MPGQGEPVLTSGRSEGQSQKPCPEQCGLPAWGSALTEVFGEMLAREKGHCEFSPLPQTLDTYLICRPSWKGTK